MTIYTNDLSDLFATIRVALAERVGPALSDDAARTELAGVIEQLDNLVPRLDWQEGALAQTVDRTEALAGRLGLETRTAASGSDPAGVDALRRRRREIATLLAGAYQDGGAPESVVEAVREFSEEDVREQISVGLRRGLPF